MLNFIKQNKVLLPLAFLLPALLMAAAFALLGIYWGSDTTTLAGDAYHQYVAIHSLYSNILHSGGTQGFFYTFTDGLGLNLYAFSAYYMGSFLMPLTFFFNVHNMPDALYLITLIKFGLIGLSAFVSLRNLYKKIAPALVLGLSTSFALMSFLTSQAEIIMWLDVFMLLPLIIWGLHSLQDLGRRRLYFISLTILFIQNYYFGFMVAIFLVLYFLARTTFGKWSWRKLFDFGLTSILSGITSLIMLLPMYLDLRANNSDALSKVSNFFTENSKPLDIFAKNFVGSYDTTQYNAVPMIYIGLLPFILALTFFAIRSIKVRTKVTFAGLLALLIASFYIAQLDLLWQGMHSPNMFLHRYAFLFSLTILILACESLQRLPELKNRYRLGAVLVLLLAFSATLLFGQYGYIKLANVLLTGLFLLVYLLLLLSEGRQWLSGKLIFLIAAGFMLAESGINAYYQLSGVQSEWHFASRSYYDQQADFLAPLAQKVQNLSGQELVRTENTSPDTANDGMKYGYNALSQFSSVRNSNSSQLMNLLGYHTDSTYLNLRYPGNTLLMDSLLGIKYNINASQPTKFDYKNIAPSLYENQAAQSLGIFVPGGFQDAKLSKNDALHNQELFLEQLTKEKTALYRQIYTTSEKTDDKITGTGKLITLTRKKPGTGDVSVTYGVTAPANSQLYLKVPNIAYFSQNATSTLLTVSKSEGNTLSPLASYSVSTDDTGDFFNLGNFKSDTPLKVSLSFPQNSQVSFDLTSFWAMDTQAYQAAMSKLSENKVQSLTAKNGVNLSYDAKSSGQILLSLPYDKGWSATLDGKPVKIEPAQQGLMKFDAPSGQHLVKVRFFPQGLKAGIVAFVLGILAFVGYDFWQKKRAQAQ